MKEPIIVIGHRGIGDNLHQRAICRELMKTREVWIETCHYEIYHDLVAQGLRLIFRSTGLRAQRKTIERENRLFAAAKFESPPEGTEKVNIQYLKPGIDQYGSILGCMMGHAGLANIKPDFSLPIRPEWRERTRALNARWTARANRKLMLYRPIVQRREWDGSSRNPEPGAYWELFHRAREGYFVISLADLQPGEEWIVGREPHADIKLHKGELDFPTMAALFAEADIGFFNAGFAPVLAQAVGLPSIVVYGGRESFRTTQAAGAHLALTLGMNPDHPCDCHSHRHRCDKTISLPPALEKVQAFATEIRDGASRHMVDPVPVEVAAHEARLRATTLIFATTYVDSEARKTLTDQWMTLTRALNPGCDILLVDSASPLRPFIDEAKYGAPVTYQAGQRAPFTLHDFGDNIGHLSRGGHDGWGRAFTFGLRAAIDCGYKYVAHIEGDLLFRLPCTPIIERMARENTAVASVPVRGMHREMFGWVETALMFFEVDYLRKSNFCERYAWERRKAAPTPEVIIGQMIRQRLKMMPWKVMRGDKSQVTHQNILALNLDGVTHCHNDIWAYDRFFEAAMPKEVMLLEGLADGSGFAKAALASSIDAPPAVAEAPQRAPVKINLGCGTNRLLGWDNHDAEVDISRPLPYLDASADFIFCEHCVEHIGYYEAIEFFKECRRVLKSDGVLRITVPSIEQIYKCDDEDYFRFTEKWQSIGATKRGAMHSILYGHGHKAPWTASLLETALYYAGFDMLHHRPPGMSDHEALRGVEGHGKVIGDKFNEIESVCFEASGLSAVARSYADSLKPPQPFAPVLARPDVAIIVGGAENVLDEVSLARTLLREAGATAEYFIINDMIAEWPDEGIAVTLHPEKLRASRDPQRMRPAGHLDRREADKLPKLKAVWAQTKRTQADITDKLPDWGGSSGGFAVAVARKLGYDKIILCGVPMTPAGKHFVRKAPWMACEPMRRRWETRRAEFSPFVRSFSGWTAKTFGEPTLDFIVPLRAAAE